MSVVFVDCEAFGGCPGLGRLTEFGAVEEKTRRTFHGFILESSPDPANPAVPLRVEITDADYYALARPAFKLFALWLGLPRPVMVSDNPAFDWQWINDGFLRTMGVNPFGHSARRLGDYYAGLVGDWRAAQRWKSLRVTPHDHSPVNDAMGNLEAFERMQRGERA